MVGPDPTIHRRRLRNALRKSREAAYKTQRDVAAEMDWSPSKLIRIETGAVSISTNDLKALLTFYGVDRERIQALVEVARLSREPIPWSVYRNVATPEYISFLGLESSAAIIRNFEPLVVPGLLQTEEYANAVISAVEESAKVEALVDLRLQRQDIFTRPAPPKLNFIMDEAVVRRVVGGPDVMRRQLKHLREVSEHPAVRIRVVPFSHGLYPRFRVPYVLFEFEADEDEDVLFVENPTGDLIIRENSPEEQGKVTPVNYLQYFWEKEQIAATDDAPAMLDDALSKLPPPPDSQ